MSYELSVLSTLTTSHSIDYTKDSNYPDSWSVIFGQIVYNSVNYPHYRHLTSPLSTQCRLTVKAFIRACISWLCLPCAYVCVDPLCVCVCILCFCMCACVSVRTSSVCVCVCVCTAFLRVCVCVCAYTPAPEKGCFDRDQLCCLD